MVTVSKDQEFITLGKLTSAYGVRGWVKVYSFTQPMDAILEYSPWYVRGLEGIKPMNVLRGRSHGDGMVASLEGVETREQAHSLRGLEVCVPKHLLPKLEAGEYYWHELIGLQVINVQGQNLGKIVDMMSAGSANDVMIVRGDANSIDQEERLIPYVVDQYVLSVALDLGQIQVDWLPEY